MTKNIRLHLVAEDAVPLLAELETAAWGPLGAGADIIRSRLSLGHTMIAASAGPLFAGAICFVETNQDPHDTANFPKTFAAYSSMAKSQPPLSLYVYNLGVRPEFRGTQLVRRLLSEMLDHGRRVGARWAVGDGRCPSYAGAQNDTPDKVVMDRSFRETIDDWHRTGVMPPVKSLTRDPLLRFYRRTLNCEFLHLAPDFLPRDASSGGYRVIFSTDVTR